MTERRSGLVSAFFLVVAVGLIPIELALLTYQLLPAVAEHRAEVAERRVMCRAIEERQQELAALRTDYKAVRMNLKERETQLGMLLDGPVQLASVGGPPIPAIDAFVRTVGQDVELNVGAMQGVEVGFHFSIYRGNEFVGKVKVTRLQLLTCRAQIVFTKEGQHIERGDSAATRLQ